VFDLKSVRVVCRAMSARRTHTSRRWRYGFAGCVPCGTGNLKTRELLELAMKLLDLPAQAARVLAPR